MNQKQFLKKEYDNLKILTNHSNISTWMVGSRKTVTAADKNGFLVPIDIIIQVYPSICDGMRFVAIFSKKADFSEYFHDKGYPCNSLDYALIICKLDGDILGINENCMTRLGIPITIFKRKGTEESITLAYFFLLFYIKIWQL